MEEMEKIEAKIDRRGTQENMGALGIEQHVIPTAYQGKNTTQKFTGPLSLQEA
jgi:hypothetical protein